MMPPLAFEAAIGAVPSVPHSATDKWMPVTQPTLALSFAISVTDPRLVLLKQRPLISAVSEWRNQDFEHCNFFGDFGMRGAALHRLSSQNHQIIYVSDARNAALLNGGMILNVGTAAPRSKSSLKSPTPVTLPMMNRSNFNAEIEAWD
jgi:hypothetical protein